MDHDEELRLWYGLIQVIYDKAERDRYLLALAFIDCSLLTRFIRIWFFLSNLLMVWISVLIFCSGCVLWSTDWLTYLV